MVTGEVTTVLDEISTSSEKVMQLINEVTLASEELSGQASELKRNVEVLSTVVGGAHTNGNAQYALAPAAPQRKVRSVVAKSSAKRHQVA